MEVIPPIVSPIPIAIHPINQAPPMNEDSDLKHTMQLKIPKSLM